MRNFKCSIADMRKQVFAEVARLAYEGGDYRRMEKLPYKIVPGEVGNQRESIFLERAIVRRAHTAGYGLPLRPVAEHSLLSDGVEESAIAEKYYDPPLVNIIKNTPVTAARLLTMRSRMPARAVWPAIARMPAIKGPLLSNADRRISTRISASSVANAGMPVPTTPSSSLPGPARRPAA